MRKTFKKSFNQKSRQKTIRKKIFGGVLSKEIKEERKLEKELKRLKKDAMKMEKELKKTQEKEEKKRIKELKKTQKIKEKQEKEEKKRVKELKKTQKQNQNPEPKPTQNQTKPKTKKKKLIFIVTNEDEYQNSLKIPQEEMVMENPLKKERYNEKFIEILGQLSDIMLKQGEPFRARAYQKAEETIIQYNGDITSPDQLKGLPAIGPTILEKLNEFVNTGTLRVIEREKTNPVNILAEIYGVGPKKAKELVEKGITTLDTLREQQMTVLNDTQRIGLKYYNDILQRIPRSEIDEYAKIFSEVFHTVSSGKNDAFEIVGSYRRGAQQSGDIDCIITSTNPNLFKTFTDKLVKTGIIAETLSCGKSKCLVITKLPNATYARRVDFLYTSPEEYPFAVLYFTGSKIFNTVMRGHALKQGYSLNEHGLYKMDGKKKGEKVETLFHGEKDIFDFLKMEYKTPEQRVDGRAVQTIGLVKPSEQAQEPVQAPVAAETQEQPEETVIILKKKSVQKKGTQKKSTTETLTNIEAFKKFGQPVLETLNEFQLAAMIDACNIAFHGNQPPLMTDNEYDIVKDYMEKKYPKNTVLHHIGAPVEKNKIKLPYEMASMDKIKPDTDALIQWKQKFKGPYVLSCKLDGVSGLYTNGKLYTRGDGKVGQDISYLLPYLDYKLPKLPNSTMAVRGEFIIPKQVFQEKYANEFANPRNLVAGIINRVTVDEKIKDVNFVCYEVVHPQMKPSEQMKTIQESGLETVHHLEVDSNKLTNEYLSSILVDWRANSPYEIDGVIVSDDNIHERKSGNPDHSFAFKMVLSDQMAEAKVVNVIWNPSKDGYLKPRVQIEPISLGGVTIEYATGFNAAFIQQNKIGLGALIQIIRSGDVIPYIKSVTVPAEEWMAPHVPYKWNDTHIDILLENMEGNITVLEKNITGFFRGIGVDGLSGGNISRIVKAGFDSIPKIIHMTKTDFLTIEGFKDKMATKVYEGIQEGLKKASLLTIMSASNMLGRGISDKKIEPVLEAFPDILTSNEDMSVKVKKVASVKGMATKTAQLFVENIPAFLVFLKETGLEYKLEETQNQPTALNMNHPLSGKTIVMTGVRDPKIAEFLKSIGAKLGSSVSKNTSIVVAKSKDEDTGKAGEARKLGIPIMTPTEFMTQFM